MASETAAAVLKAFKDSDAGHTGVLSRKQLQETLKKIQSCEGFSDDQSYVLLYPWGGDKIEYEKFVFWVFGDAAKLKELQQKSGFSKIALFDCASYDRESFQSMNKELGFGFEFQFFHEKLSTTHAQLAQGCNAVCIFVNDCVDGDVIRILHGMGVKMIALRCAGFDRVDLNVAEECGMTVARVPAYSPHAVAEHAVTLMLCLNRRFAKAVHKTKMTDFTLDSLMGKDMYGKRVGVIGTGLIGSIAARILKQGFGCDVVAYDKFPSKKVSADEPEGLGIPYVTLDELFKTADFITLHAPLLPATKHTINADAISKMKPGVTIVNTSRGGLIDTEALIDGLRQGKIGGAGLDVVEGEGPYFFQDYSRKIIKDKNILVLTRMPNVIITAHQAFFTAEAMRTIAHTTLMNIDGVRKGSGPPKQKGILDTVCKPAPKAGPAPPPQSMQSRANLMPELQPAPPPMEKPILPPIENKASGDFKVAMFSARFRESFDKINTDFNTNITFIYHDARLEVGTVHLAKGCDAACIFVNDDASSEVLQALKAEGVKMVALRCTGFNNVDLEAAKAIGMSVVHVPADSPWAAAEHSVTMAVGLIRHIPQALYKTRTGDFTLQGLLGSDMGSDTGKKSIGIVGTGRTGKLCARIFKRGYGCDVMAYDISPDSTISDPPPAGLGIPYVTKEELFSKSDIILFHVPLTPQTKHLISMETVNLLKPGVTLINTSRGGIIDTKALIKGLEEGIVANAGLDVIEAESGYFLQDFSGKPMMDDDLSVLLGFPNVAITPHQAFLTEEAVHTIAYVTIASLNAMRNGNVPPKQNGTDNVVLAP